MRHRPMLIVAVLCVTLIALGVLASRRAEASRYDLERDGARVVFRRAFGFIPLSHTEPDPSLHVSADLGEEFRRLGIKLPPAIAILASRASRQRLTGLQTSYSFGGEISGNSRDAVDALARQVPGARRRTTAADDQLDGTCADGQSYLDVHASSAGGAPWVSVGLRVATR